MTKNILEHISLLQEDVQEEIASLVYMSIKSRKEENIPKGGVD